jgi:hypothetical protein
MHKNPAPAAYNYRHERMYSMGWSDQRERLRNNRPASCASSCLGARAWANPGRDDARPHVSRSRALPCGERMPAPSLCECVGAHRDRDRRCEPCQGRCRRASISQDTLPERPRLRGGESPRIARCPLLPHLPHRIAEKTGGGSEARNVHRCWARSRMGSRFHRPGHLPVLSFQKAVTSEGDVRRWPSFNDRRQRNGRGQVSQVSRMSERSAERAQTGGSECPMQRAGPRTGSGRVGQWIPLLQDLSQNPIWQATQESLTATGACLPTMKAGT